MALVYKDRVKQTVDAPSGSAAFDFDSNGATPTGYQSFVDALADTNTCIYAAEDTSGNWEVGVGTWAEADKTITRTTILASSNSGSAESFSGTVTVYITNSAKAEELSAVFGLSEVSVTTTATATIGNMHVCSGTSADYTVTLPAASGNAGRLIGFRMSGALTKLITIDGNASETIDGETTRIMWAGESAILLCDGSNWFKVAGKAKAMLCVMRLSSDQGSVGNGAVTKCNLNASVLDNTGLMADTTNYRINIKRSGEYLVVGAVRFDSIGSVAISSILWKDGASFAQAISSTPSGGYFGIPCVSPTTCTAANYIELAAYQASGGDETFEGGALGDGVCYLNVSEIPQW